MSGSGLLRHTLLDAAGQSRGRNRRPGSPGRNAQELTVKDAHLWDTASPYLYTLRSELIKSGEATDTVDTTVGIRSIALDREQGLPAERQAR